ncbi:MAG TPA: hypothetical protein PKC18_16145 [Lacipirellulaceae bacterium]|nr:hypothetical protein [Lacipirellulaceae bacterium]
MRRALLVAIAGLLTAAAARGESYNEAIFGDLSSDPAFPSPILLSHGFNNITGTMGGGDIDILELTLPEYHRVDSLILGAYSGGGQSFAGLQAGNVWTAGTLGSVNPAMLMGWTHFGPAAAGAGLGQDLFINMSTPNLGSSGFDRPLGPGVYAFLIQDTGPETAYSLRFNVTYDLKPVGDFNGDFFITAADLVVWRAAYLTTLAADANGDGVTDGADFLAWQRHIGRVDFGFVAAPEPASLALAWVFLAAANAGRRRRSPAPQRQAA